MEIFKTIYDGFFIAKNKNGKIFAYEGYNLCPKNVQKQIDNGNFTELDCTYMDAVSYGYV